MFNERKAAQIAAYFLGQTQTGRMPHLKLIKLIYLAEREAIHRLGMTLTGDCFFSLPHGPVLSATLDLMNDSHSSPAKEWGEWIHVKKNHHLSLRKKFNLDELDELSRGELAILHSIWQQFGQLNQWEIRDWTHDHCPEWQDPKGSAQPISLQSIALAVGFDQVAANSLATRMEEEQRVDALFASLS